MPNADLLRDQLSEDGASICVFSPELAVFQLESMPASPWTMSSTDIAAVEDNMMLR